MIHRDLPDSELHALKGAASAIAGSVPVSDGAGNTNFQKLGVVNLTGSLPTSLSDLLVGTDGTGGFKGVSAAYGGFQYDSAGPTLVSTTALVGMSILAGAVKVAASGIYLLVTDVRQTFTVETVAYETLKPTLLKRIGDGVTVFSGFSGLVVLDTAQTYNLSESGKFSLWKVNV